MKKYTRVCARVDLDAVGHNVDLMHRNLSPGTGMIAVVKADGYGHGAVQIARFLEPRGYVWGFAAATLEEAVILKKAGIQKPLIVLGCIFPDQWESMIEYGIRMTCYSEEAAREVSALAARMGRKAYIHIKLDTGMSRLGFPVSKESVECVARIAGFPNLVTEGMYTHFARADETDRSFTQMQISRYLWMKEQLRKKQVEFAYYHCSNSAGVLGLRQADMDLVRPGISIYGLYPSKDIKKESVPLRPAMELISHIVHVKWIDEGTPVSYGGTFLADRKMKVATIPVGYGDGYPRSLSGKGYVLIDGKRAPILGRICMDQFMVDVTGIEGASVGDKATLVGKNGNEFLSAERLSEMSGRFHYEFVCDLGKRIPREFIRGGQVVEQTDCFA